MGKSFKGGILLREKPAAYLETEALDPIRVILPVKHGYTLKVKPGMWVKRGDILAASNSEDEMPTLSTIGGIVAEADDDRIIVESNADNTVSDLCAPLGGSILGYSPEQLRRALLALGVKIPPMPERKIKCFVINCVENDSYVSSRARLLSENPDRVIGGAKILMKIFGVRQGILAVPSAMLDAANALEAYCPPKMLKVKLVGNKFPQQNPNILISSLFNVEINPTIDPTSIGYLVFEPELCAAVFSALAEGEPYTHRTVTVTGDCSGYIANVSVPFGTEVGEVLDRCGGLVAEPAVILQGGEMSQRALSLGDLVTSETAGLTALSKSLLPESTAALPCIGCGRCVSACPVRLMPSMIKKAAENGNVQACLDLDIECCIGCGCCTAACPSGIDLAEQISAARDVISGIIERAKITSAYKPLIDSQVSDTDVIVLMNDSQTKLAEKAPTESVQESDSIAEMVFAEGLSQVASQSSIGNEDELEYNSFGIAPEADNAAEDSLRPISGAAHNRSAFSDAVNSENGVLSEVTGVSDSETIFEPVLFDEQLNSPEVEVPPDEAALRINVNRRRAPTKRFSAALRSTETPLSITVDLIVAMLPLLAWSVYLFGARPIVIAALSVAASLGVSMLADFAVSKTARIRDPLAVSMGLAIALALPPTAPLWLPIAAGAVAAVIRLLSKVTAPVCVDPAVATLTVLSLAMPKVMTALCGVGSRLAPLSINATGNILPAGETALEALSAKILPHESLGSMFVGMRTGLIGETSALILIAVGIYLACRKLIRPGLPITFILTVFVLSYFTPQVEIVSDIIALQYSAYQVLAADTLLGAVILASSPYIKPLSGKAGIALGIIGGAITVLMRLFIMPNISVLAALLVISLLARPFDKLLRPSVFGGKVIKKK